jgi:excisionase family DNA binding protein
MTASTREAGAAAAAPTEVWNPVETAAYLQIPVATLYAWRNKGKGPPAARVGKHLRYRKSGVDQWLDEQTENG